MTRRQWAALAILAAAIGSSCGTTTAEDPLPPTTATVEDEPAGEERDDLEAAATASEDLFADLAASDGPGCAAGASLDGDTVFSAGYGMADVENGVPVDPATRFDIASISKSFTAASILLLADRGVVGLDDSIRVWLPELPPGWDEVTIDDLLHHTSGVPSYEDGLLDDFTELEPTTVDDALAVLVGEPSLEFGPGTRWEYSNSGYFLLALIAARSTDAAFETVVATTVLEPLGLEETTVRSDWSVPVPDGARGYADSGEGWIRYESQWSQQGDGAVQSTVGDLLVWADEWRTADALGPELRDRMQEPVRLADGTTIPYGAGLELDTDEEGRRVVGHSGGWAGFTSDLRLYPDEGVAVVVLCNIDDFDEIDDLSADLATIWLDR